MEDAEAIILSLPNHPNVAFFGVFDGHNGAAASKWSAQHVPQYLDRLDEFTPEKIQQALLQADADFLKTDTKFV
jgi:protein phosphatase 2C family protein 2/3